MEGRIGVAPIRIETGQCENLNEKKRFCLLCNDNVIENEEHVVLRCFAYNDIRSDLLTSARYINSNLIDDDKLSLSLF